MANELSIPNNFGPVASAFAGQQGVDDLSAGIQGGFGLIGYRGKVWSLRHRGVERQLMRPDGDGPQNSIEVVILKSSNHVAKIFYEAGYVEGSTAAPDCFSTNGMIPDAGAAKKQGTTCASCAKNAWGSRITPGGKQGKACSDSKRLAVVPLADMRNEAFGGPMLLRVPAASLNELAQFGEGMRALGYPYYSIAVRVAFDAAESYPKFKFSAIRPLTNEEAAVVVEMQKLPAVARILSEGAEHAGTPQAALPSPFEQPVAPMGTPVLSAPVAPVPSAAPVAPAPVVAPSPVAAAQPVAAGGTVSGFGPLAEAAPAAAVPSTPTAPTSPATAAPSASPSEGFDAALDEQLHNLLPD